MKKRKIAIFASGNGTNAAQLIKHFKSHPHIQVGLIVSNSTKSGVLKVAKDNNVPFIQLQTFYPTEDKVELRKIEMGYEDFVIDQNLVAYFKK